MYQRKRDLNDILVLSSEIKIDQIKEDSKRVSHASPQGLAFESPKLENGQPSLEGPPSSEEGLRWVNAWCRQTDGQIGVQWVAIPLPPAPASSDDFKFGTYIGWQSA